MDSQGYTEGCQGFLKQVVYEIMFLICKSMYILKVYSIHTQKLRKILLDKINVTKNGLFFLLWPPTHHSVTFNLKFLCQLKHKACLSKSGCGTFHFRFGFIFITVYIFIQQNE